MREKCAGKQIWKVAKPEIHTEDSWQLEQSSQSALGMIFSERQSIDRDSCETLHVRIVKKNFALICQSLTHSITKM